MTNAEMVSKIRTSLKWNAADISITERAILQQARDVRNKYVYQKLNRRQGWDSSNVFTPLYIKFEQVPLADFCEYQSDCTISRSIYKLPKLGEGIFSIASPGMFTLNGKKKFIPVSASRYENLLKLNLPKKDIYYWIFNGKMWTSEPLLEAAIFPAFVEGEIPQEFSINCEDQNSLCPENPMNQEFRCFSGMENDITNAVVEFYMKTFKRSVEDNISDSLDESK